MDSRARLLAPGEEFLSGLQEAGRRVAADFTQYDESRTAVRVEFLSGFLPHLLAC